MFEQKITFSPGLVAMMRNCRDKAGVGAAIARAMDRENEFTVTLIRGKLAGPVLQRRTGLLSNSISQTDAIVIADGAINEVRSTVGSNARTGGEAVSYAAPLEFGSKPHLIRPLPGRGPKASLRFIGRNGQVVFAKAVNHPGNKAYNFVGGTVTERLPNYEKSLGDAAFGFLTGGNGGN